MDGNWNEDDGFLKGFFNKQAFKCIDEFAGDVEYNDQLPNVTQSCVMCYTKWQEVAGLIS